MRCNVINHGRPLVRLFPQSSNDHVWISDSFVADTFARFSHRVLVQHKRHGGNVPGPLEARKRGTKRRNTHLAHAHGAQSSGFLATLFGSSKHNSTVRYEPPNLAAPKGAELPFHSVPRKDQSPDPPPPPLELNFQALDISSNEHEFDLFPLPERQTDTWAHEPDPIIPEECPSADSGGQEAAQVLPHDPEIELVDTERISMTQDLEDATLTSPRDIELQTSKNLELDGLLPEDYALKTGNWAVTYRAPFDSPIFADMKTFLEDICDSKFDSDHVRQMVARFKLRGPSETALLLAEHLCSRNQIQHFISLSAEASNRIYVKHGLNEMHEISSLMWVILRHNPYPISAAWKAILMTVYQAWGAGAVLQVVQTVRSYRRFPGILFHEGHSFVVEMLRRETLRLDTDPDPESAARLCELIKAFMFPHVFTEGLEALPFRLIKDGKIGASEVMELVQKRCSDKLLVWELVNSRVRVSKDRVEYINKLAHAFSVAPNYTHAQAWRGVRRCYYYLYHRSASITPDFTRALVRAGIIRPLLAGRWVPNAKLLFIFRIVEGVEGTETALSLEKLAYEWRQKLIQEAVDVYKRARLGGEVRVNTATELICYHRRLEEQEDEDEDEGEGSISNGEQLRIRREIGSSSWKERARNAFRYENEKFQPGQVFGSA